MSHRQAIIKLVQFLRENYPDVQYFNTPCLANDYQEEVYRDEEVGIYAMFAPDWGYIDLYGVSPYEFASFVRNEHLIKDEEENETTRKNN